MEKTYPRSAQTGSTWEKSPQPGGAPLPSGFLEYEADKTNAAFDLNQFRLRFWLTLSADRGPGELGCMQEPQAIDVDCLATLSKARWTKYTLTGCICPLFNDALV